MEREDDVAPVWQPGESTMGPRSCPICGAVVAGAFMERHVEQLHPDQVPSGEPGGA